MLNVHVKIEKELAVKGWRRAFRFRYVDTLLYYYAIRLVIVWLVVAMVDAIGGERDLAPKHAGALAIVWIGIVAYDYVRWYRDLEEKTVGWEYDAVVDDEGVVTYSKAEREEKREWSWYKFYKEYDGYLELHDQEGNVAFLPKTEELSEAVAFTKTKVLKK
jgi:hypothetical protein